MRTERDAGHSEHRRISQCDDLGKAHNRSFNVTLRKQKQLSATFNWHIMATAHNE